MYSEHDAFALAIGKEIFGQYAKVKSVGSAYPEMWNTFAQFIGNNFNLLEDILKEFKTGSHNGTKFTYNYKGKHLRVLKNFLMFGAEVGLFKWKQIKASSKFYIEFEKDNRKQSFLDGGWFELFLENVVRRALSSLDNVSIVRNVNIKLVDGSEAEIDIAIKANEKLYIIEAKSGKAADMKKYRKLVTNLGISQDRFAVIHADGSVRMLDGNFTKVKKVESFLNFFKEWICCK